MIKIEKTAVTGFEHAIRGMRNPMNSWDKSDSAYGCISKDIYYLHRCDICSVAFCKNRMKNFVIGENDLTLMKKLSKAGTDHRKFLRMIIFYVDITAPLYWWKEFDTYKVGTVANSCSTMHKISDKEFELTDFSHEHLTNEVLPECWNENAKDVLGMTIDLLNANRLKFIETKEKKYWWQMIQLLPSSYNQKRTVMLNYEVLMNMYNARKSHKLDEWREFCEWIVTLPYSELIIQQNIE